MKSNKTSKALISSLRGICRRGGMEPERVEVLQNLFRKLDHAVAVGDRAEMRKAWNDIARELCDIFVVRGA
jgi:hypothetical protein